MTRDEHRAKCVEAIAMAMMTEMLAPHELPDALEYARVLQSYLIAATAAFDALHGLARVVPIEATDEMHSAVRRVHRWDVYEYEVFNCMSATGDLTNPPEGKP